MITRRGVFGTLFGFLAAPAIVKLTSLMPVHSWDDTFTLQVMYSDGIRTYPVRTITVNGVPMVQRMGPDTFYPWR